MARQTHTATIAAGASQSSIIDCGSEYTLVGIEIPSSWTTADITFLGAAHTGISPAVAFGQSPQDVLETQLTFRQLVDVGGTEIKVTVGATGDKFVTIPDYLLKGVQFLKIRSGTLAAPVVQAAARTLICTVAE